MQINKQKIGIDKGEIKIDTAKFKDFSQKCSKELPNEIDKILQNANGKKACSISFITTDDFMGGFYYGMFVFRGKNPLILCSFHSSFKAS